MSTCVHSLASSTENKWSRGALPSSLEGSLSTSRHAHAHTGRTPSRLALCVFLFGVGISALHSDGEMMTMAHYPLPEEWI